MLLSFLCFTFSLTLTYSTLPHYSVFIVCSEVGRDVFMMQPHGSVRNCQLSFKSDWPPLGATPQILTLKARERKKKKESKDTLLHFQKLTTKSHMLWLYLNLRGLKKYSPHYSTCVSNKVLWSDDLDEEPSQTFKVLILQVCVPCFTGKIKCKKHFPLYRQ